MARSKTAPLTISRIDFFRLREEEFFGMLVRAVDDTLGEGKQREKRWASLSPLQRGVWAWWGFWGDVLNGGLTQYFYNHTDRDVPAIEWLLEAAGASALAAPLKEAVKVYRKHRKAFEVENP
ncbi:MAG TPA: DUF4375 domain-containing protein, partial [Lacunisphaera sp.]|nr:DUF4375 domain-containing protein [Lacunisphaera sp.]